MMIEHGWKVLDARGEEIGRVDEIAGDENATSSTAVCRSSTKASR